MAARLYEITAKQRFNKHSNWNFILGKHIDIEVTIVAKICTTVFNTDSLACP